MSDKITLHNNMPDAEYFDGYSNYMSSHRLHSFSDCPAAFIAAEQADAEYKASAAMLLGTAIHTMILEPVFFLERYVVGYDPPVNPTTKQPYKTGTKKNNAWKSELESDGKTLLSVDEFNLICDCKNNVTSHSKANSALLIGKPEVVLRGELCGVPSQAKIDWLDLHNKTIVDLKTIDNIDKFQYNFSKFGYGRQMAFYRMMMRKYCQQDFAIKLVVVETTGIHRVGVFSFGGGALAHAEQQTVSAFSEYRRAKEKNVWPTKYEAIRELN